jgi:hypothetical protein
LLKERKIRETRETKGTRGILLSVFTGVTRTRMESAISVVNQPAAGRVGAGMSTRLEPPTARAKTGKDRAEVMAGAGAEVACVAGSSPRRSLNSNLEGIPRALSCWKLKA